MTRTAKQPDEARRKVREHYARAITERTGCCPDEAPPSVERLGYAPGDIELISVDAPSFGCANPVALADLRPGEVVLDLGSGAGLDALLSARRVGPRGRVYGLDMTLEMLERARANAAGAGAGNAEFLEGTLEAIPLPDESVDVIISNCVINLSPDKPRALREAFRVLRRGGRLAIADMVRDDGARRSPSAPGDADWCACVGGALTKREYGRQLRDAGFTGVTVEMVESAPFVLGDARSAFIRAERPR